MLCEKVNYISKNQAKKIRKHRSMKSKRVSVYKCPFCRYFHTANTKHMRKSKRKKMKTYELYIRQLYDVGSMLTSFKPANPFIQQPFKLTDGKRAVKQRNPNARGR